ncbi:MAG: hypothetical protein ABJQ70_09560 [Roseobacter sp.]
MFDTGFNHFKSVFAHNFFVEPADRNYFLARFSKAFGMPEEFWWHALQAVEKYLKAGLFLNGRSVKKGFGHTMEELWDEQKNTFAELLVDRLEKTSWVK